MRRSLQFRAAGYLLVLAAGAFGTQADDPLVRFLGWINVGIGIVGGALATFQLRLLKRKTNG